jgi:hypothetical protein
MFGNNLRTPSKKADGLPVWSGGAQQSPKKPEFMVDTSRTRRSTSTGPKRTGGGPPARAMHNGGSGAALGGGASLTMGNH